MRDADMPLCSQSKLAPSLQRQSELVPSCVVRVLRRLLQFFRHKHLCSAGGHFTLEWIKVGDEACNSDFEHKAAKTTFYDLFDTEEIEDEEDPSCSEGYTLINAQPGYLECLKVKEGKELQASRFETRRCATQTLVVDM